MRILDAHTHVLGGRQELNELMEELDLKFLNVDVAHSAGSWRETSARYRQQAEMFPQRYAWCTSFDPPDFQESDYPGRVVEQLNNDFSAGAIACKIWKNIGMEVKDPDGNFVLMDHPVFDPIYDCLTEAGKPLLMHMAEPLGCWQPLTEDNPHRLYYSEHPEWHMYGRTDCPHHRDILAARDRVIESRPNMTFIAAHMASLEHDLGLIADLLDRCPNLAVDQSRVYDMTFLDRDEVREFHVKYQDRILFATDLVIREELDEMSEDKRKAVFANIRDVYETQRAFYETDGEFVMDGSTGRGIALDEKTREKIYFANAERWYPGV